MFTATCETYIVYNHNNVLGLKNNNLSCQKYKTVNKKDKVFNIDITCHL